MRWQIRQPHIKKRHLKCLEIIVEKDIYKFTLIIKVKDEKDLIM